MLYVGFTRVMSYAYSSCMKFYSSSANTHNGILMVTTLSQHDSCSSFIPVPQISLMTFVLLQHSLNTTHPPPSNAVWGLVCTACLCHWSGLASSAACPLRYLFLSCEYINTLWVSCALLVYAITWMASSTAYPLWCLSSVRRIDYYMYR